MSRSRLAKTWLVDLDGTTVSHNGHLRGEERLLHGVREWWRAIPPEDTVVLLTARKRDEIEAALAFLHGHGLRVDHVLCDLPTGERILINDRKPDGTPTAFSFNVDRDRGLSELTDLCRHLLGDGGL